jgi:alpha-tubulin suppressor-like RCC1 family protein
MRVAWLVLLVPVATSCNRHVSSEKGWSQVDAGVYQTCGIEADGTVQCWGCEKKSEVTEHTATNVGQCVAPAGVFIEVATGPDMSCALSNDRDVTCWPEVEAVAALGGVDHIGVGEGYGCALLGQTISCWGTNSSPSGKFEQVGVGRHHLCALTKEGEAECWAATDDFVDEGQLEAPDTDFVTVKAGESVSCGLTERGTVECWGDSALDYEGSNDMVWTDLTVGYGHACVLDGDGLPYCWGNDDFGQASVTWRSFEQLSAGGVHTCGLDLKGRVRCYGDDTARQTFPP